MERICYNCKQFDVCIVSNEIRHASRYFRQISEDNLYEKVTIVIAENCNLYSEISEDDILPEDIEALDTAGGRPIIDLRDGKGVP